MERALRRAQAFHLGLLDTAGLHHVCVAAVKDQRYATCRYSMDRHIRWPLVVDQLADDVAVANQLLPPDKQARRPPSDCPLRPAARRR